MPIRQTYSFRTKKKLFYSAYNNNFKEIKKLLKQGYDPNETTEFYAYMIDGTYYRYDMSILEWACRKNNIKLLDLLIKYNCDVNKHVHYKSTLQITNNYNIVKKLIDAGCDTNSISIWYSTPIIKACKYNHLELVKLLIENNCDINKRGDRRKTALINACSFNNNPLFYKQQNENHIKNNIKIVELLLKKRCDVNLKDSWQRNALSYACELKKKNIVKMLILNYADISSQHKDSSKLSYKYWIKEHKLIDFFNNSILESGLIGLLIRYIRRNWYKYIWNIDCLPKDLRIKIHITKGPIETAFNKSILYIKKLFSIFF